MSQPKTIYWKTYDIRYGPVKESNTCWKIRTQSTLKIEPGEKKNNRFKFWLCDEWWGDFGNTSRRD